MAKLEEILKAKGATDEDLKTLEPLLSNARYREALEGQLTELAADRDKFKGEAERWSTWFEDTGKPTVDKALKDAQDARAEAASHASRLKTLQEQGLLKIEEGDKEEKARAAAADSGEPFDPKKYNLVTTEDVAKYADAEGQAIALAQDISAEYQELFGKSLFSYVGADGSRGFRALRAEAQAARKPLDKFVAEKFNFQGRRQELITEADKKKEAEIRADERANTIKEIANPNARPPQGSRSSFIPRPDTAGKQPWEKEPGAATDARVSKALTRVLQGA